MSLKAITATTAGQGTLRGNVDYHAACRTSHADPDAAVSRSRRHAQLRRDRPQAGLRADRTYPTRLPIPRSVQEGQRHRAPLLGQDQRTQPLANHPLDRPLARARRPRAARFQTPPLPAPLHARRYHFVGPSRRRARRPLGPRHPSHSRTRVQSLRQDRIPTISRDLALPHLQPTAHPGLSRTPCTPHQDARRGGEHRRAPQARSGRPPRLPASRHGASRRHRFRQGTVSHQCRRHGHAMGGGGLLRNHLRGPFAAGFRGPAASVSLSRPRLFTPTPARSFSTIGWPGCWRK